MHAVGGGQVAVIVFAWTLQLNLHSAVASMVLPTCHLQPEVPPSSIMAFRCNDSHNLNLHGQIITSRKLFVAEQVYYTTIHPEREAVIERRENLACMVPYKL